MHKKCGSEVVIDHRDDRTFESDVKEQGDEEFYREQVIPLYSDLYRFLRAFVGDRESDGNEPQHHADLSAQRTESIPQSVCVFKLRIG